MFYISGQYFNPHFREGSDRIICVNVQGMTDFNPHFREGSDDVTSTSRGRFEISIHTSAKEVTDVDALINKLKSISIHTSAKEVTIFYDTDCLIC